MKIGSIASGSDGNCIYVGSEQTNLLVDTGISGVRIRKGLEEYGLTMEEIHGILITHEHIDHIKGLGVLSRKYHIPIYATQGTIHAIQKKKSVGKIENILFRNIEKEEHFLIGDIEVYALPISHDAADPVAFRMEGEGKKIAIVTDLGYYDKRMIEQLQGLDVILLESNHEETLVEVSSYPYELKMRVLGKQGHLSNANAGRFLREILHPNMQKIILGHLSNENNMPHLAYETVRLELTMSQTHKEGMEYPLMVAKRSSVTEIIELL
ncbi:MAG: MBL fold metallo-hydrolase [Eubacteriales bacterium]